MSGSSYWIFTFSPRHVEQYPTRRPSDEKTLGHFAADAFQQSLEAIPGQIWGTEEMVSFHMCMRVYKF